MTAPNVDPFGRDEEHSAFVFYDRTTDWPILVQDWRQTLMDHEQMTLEIEKSDDVCPAAEVLAAVARELKFHGRHLVFELEDYGSLEQEEDGSSFRPVRFMIDLTVNSYLHDVDAPGCGQLTGGRMSNVQQLGYACRKEMEKNEAVVLHCLGRAAFLQTFRTVRELTKMLETRGKRLSMALVYEKKRQANSSKKIKAYTFHLHMKDIPTNFRFKM